MYSTPILAHFLAQNQGLSQGLGDVDRDGQERAPGGQGTQVPQSPDQRLVVVSGDELPNRLPAFFKAAKAMNRVRGLRDLIPRRYYSNVRLDLMDQIQFFGATRRRSLHYYCMLFGIESPTAPGSGGHEVDALWREGRYQEIAEYCWRDVKATAELYKVWSTYIKPTGEEWPEFSPADEAGTDSAVE